MSQARTDSGLSASSSAGERYSMLYSFGKLFSGDAARPGGLIDVGGVLYGTTPYGGAHSFSLGGTIYSVSTTGTEHVLYSFPASPSDGFRPQAALTDVNGTLYGTTVGGGTNGYGTVFSMSLSGTETVLHNFAGGADGVYPAFRMINVNGTLYGTTTQAGDDAQLGGTVFSISPSGAYSVLHVFPASATDGVQPSGELVDVNGTLYGTTSLGGTKGLGTVFSVNPTTGDESVLYNFKGAPDGANPSGALLDLDGTLYGTTSVGGTSHDGTVYSVSTTGAEHVLHSFAGHPTDGLSPNGSLINVNGTLYGTTFRGGSNYYGTIFAITPAGAERVVHSFDALVDYGGDGPESGLFYSGGTLYGTTTFGGMYDDGLVFALHL